MLLRRALPLAIGLLVAGVAPALAQMAPPSSCAQLLSLKQDLEKRFLTAKSAVDRKAPAAEACRAFTQFSDTQAKFIKEAEEQGAWCGFPTDQLPQMKAGHAQSLDARKQACAAAAAGPPRPAAPSLSDALGTPVPNANTTRTGRGTFDTLSGNPLAR
jgi:hypothetical protein